MFDTVFNKVSRASDTSESRSDISPQKGIVSFIKMKLESAVHPEDIRKMLSRAGFPLAHVDAAFDHVRKNHDLMHQDLAAANGFLPPLADKGSMADKDSAYNLERRGVKTVTAAHGAHSTYSGPVQHKGLFAGRLRRKDFILGFIFFFAIGYVTLTISAVLLSLVAPDIWQSVLAMIEADANNSLMMLVPVILAPISIMMFSLIARRLHNLGLSGGLGLLFFIWFLPSFSEVYKPGLLALDFALLVMFILLITVKGHPEPNRYGPLPESRGSFFRRIFNM